jgi:hypothetical protein
METMTEWYPALTKQECNSKELGTCYCGECEGEGDDVDTVSWSSSNPTGEVASNE